MPELPNTTARKPEEERFTLGNFEILRDETGGPLMLGKGTFGRTYKARHRFLDTIVALKVITERYVADATVRQRFLAEAKAVARLSHPNIASIYDFGEADGALYYAMEFCSGGNLSSYVLKRGPLGVPQVLEIAIQASGALACAHAASFVHRDVKPSNLMLASPEGPLCCKLIDFGLVHATSPSAQPGPPGHPDEGQFFGTPLFASPEQLREQPVDGRSDLFSLGMTLWFLLLGGPPEPGAFSAIATSRLSPESYLPRLPKDLPAPLLHLLGQLLEKDPALRVADGAAAYAAFLRCASVLGMPAAPQISAPGGLGSGEPQASERNREVPPAEIEEVPEVLESKFKLTSRLNVAFTGTFYAAEPRDRVGQTVLLHVLQPEVAQDAALVEQIRANIGRLQAFAPPSVIRPMAIRRYQDFTAVEMGALPAGVLLNELRSQGILLFSKVCPFLEAVALQNDQIEELTLPGLDLRPASVFFDAGEAKASGAADLAKVTPRLLPRLVAATEAGSLESSGPADTSSTMTSDNFGDPARDNNSGAQFAGLIYRIVSGRNSPAAASLSPQGYVAASGLSERANRILSLVIAGQTTYSTCGEMLRELLGLEGVSGSMAGSQGATHSKAPAMQTRSFAPIARSAETATFARTSAPPGRVTRGNVLLFSWRSQRPRPCSPWEAISFFTAPTPAVPLKLARLHSPRSSWCNCRTMTPSSPSSRSETKLFPPPRRGIRGPSLCARPPRNCRLF
jgi:serine/threonine protein kinase